MGTRTTWAQKRDKADEPVLKPLDRRFAGHDVGDLMYISTAGDFNRRIRRLRSGTALTIPEFRDRVARRVGADFTCPLSSGIFLRIVAEAALEDLAGGADLERITPFWRVIEPSSALASTLTCGPSFIREQRLRESDD